jgi:hypothetical protein
MNKVTRRFLVTCVSAVSVFPGTALLTAAVKESTVGNTGQAPASTAKPL